jgi:glycosyltransferase involved in cell wall biosynthesis
MKSVQGSGAPLPEADRLPISAFVICMNEAAYIANCLLSLKACAEIVVVDSGSTDETLSIIQGFIDGGWPIRLISQAWLGYAAQKQFALDQCTQPWCFNIDSDERLDAALRAELPKMIAAGEDVVGWRVSRRPYLIGYGYTPSFVRERKNLRLIRKGAGAYDLMQKVHEGIVTKGRVLNSARGSLLHYRPLPIDEQILKENAYSTLKADQKAGEGRRSSFAKLIFSPIAYFIRLYIFNRLIVCGWPGFVQAMTGAVYSFLTEAKILQRQARARVEPFDNMDGEGL